MTTDSEAVPPFHIQVKYTNAPTSEEWDQLQDTLKELYVDQKMTLKQLRKRMQDDHGFYASEKMYKSRFRAWHMDKNIKSQDMEFAMNNYPDEQSDIVVNGKTITRAHLQRWQRRQHKAQSRSVTSSRAGSTISSHRDSLRDLLAVSSSTSVSSLSPESIISSPTVSTIGYSTPNSSTDDSEEYLSSTFLGLDSEIRRTASPPPMRTGSLDRSGGRTPIQSPLSQPPMVLSPAVLHNGLIPQARLWTQPFDPLPIPTRPVMRIRRPLGQMQLGMIDQSLLIALLLTALTRSLQLSNILDSQIENSEADLVIDIHMFSRTVDLLGWLQLDHIIVLVAVVYLCRFKDSESLSMSNNVWHQLLVALKFAQTLHDDDVFDKGVWYHASEHHGLSTYDLLHLELKILATPDITLHIDMHELNLLMPKFRHILVKLKAWDDEGKLNSVNAARVKWTQTQSRTQFLWPESSASPQKMDNRPSPYAEPSTKAGIELAYRPPLGTALSQRKAISREICDNE